MPPTCSKTTSRRTDGTAAQQSFENTRVGHGARQLEEDAAWALDGSRIVREPDSPEERSCDTLHREKRIVLVKVSSEEAIGE